jgi:hypothetical protein
MTLPALFGRLEPVALREAWPHEAHDFTPWLIENIDRLAEAVGIPLEVVRAEALVDGLQGDLLARGCEDGSVVLIENQLETSDHDHLARILTYLARLDAQTAIWIAGDFKEPHLSVIRWLNAKTSTPFAFFAIRLSVVRIGASPLAPTFEVVEGPSEWDRRLRRSERVNVVSEAVDGLDAEIWRQFLWRYPDEVERSRLVGARCRWRTGLPQGLVVGLQILDPVASVFIRGRPGVPIEAVLERLTPFAETLEMRLGVSLAIENRSILAVKKRMIAAADRDRCNEIVNWMRSEADNYEAAVRECVRD